jgi:hypothetical protein
LYGKLWDNTPDVNISTSSVIESYTKNYKRNTSIPNQLVVNDLMVVDGKSKDFSFIKEQTFKYVSNIEEIENIPILYLYTTPLNSWANEGVSTSLYKIGDYSSNRAEKVNINTTSIEKNIINYNE